MKIINFLKFIALIAIQIIKFEFKYKWLEMMIYDWWGYFSYDSILYLTFLFKIVAKSCGGDQNLNLKNEEYRKHIAQIVSF